MDLENLKVMVSVNLALTLLLVALVMKEQYGIFQAFAFIAFVMLSMLVYMIYRIIREAFRR